MLADVTALPLALLMVQPLVYEKVVTRADKMAGKKELTKALLLESKMVQLLVIYWVGWMECERVDLMVALLVSLKAYKWVHL